jgi:hypothetical protein
LSNNLYSTMRGCGRTPDSSHSSFGAIGVVLLTGDHHQNRIVHGAPLFQGNGDIRSGTAADTAGRTAANAHRDGPGWDTQFVNNLRGRHILGQLHTTVLLQAEIRMDPDLSTLNARLRDGCLTDVAFDDINACAIGAPENLASIHHPNHRNAHFMVLRHTMGDAIVHALLPRLTAKYQQQLCRWSAKDGIRTCRDDAWTPVTDRRLRVPLGRLIHNKTGDAPSVMYIYNGMSYIFRHSENIDCLYFYNKGATAVALLLDDATARHPSPNAPTVTLGDMPRAMVVCPRNFGIPMHRVCHDLPNGHVAVMPTTIYFTWRFPAAFRLESGFIVKSIQIKRVGFSMIPDIVCTDFFAQGATSSLDKTYVLDLRPTNASAKFFQAWSSL